VGTRQNDGAATGADRVRGRGRPARRPMCTSRGPASAGATTPATSRSPTVPRRPPALAETLRRPRKRLRRRPVSGGQPRRPGSRHRQRRQPRRQPGCRR